MVSNIFYFHPYLGKIPNLANIFQWGWNHQLDNFCKGDMKWPTQWRSEMAFLGHRNHRLAFRCWRRHMMDVICWGSITQLNDRCWIVITACAFNVRVETSSLHSSSIMIIITIHHEKSWNSHDVLITLILWSHMTNQLPGDSAKKWPFRDGELKRDPNPKMMGSKLWDDAASPRGSPPGKGEIGT